MRREVLQQLLFSRQKERRDRFMPEGAQVLHKAYKFTPFFLLLCPIYCLSLSLCLSYAQHPFLHDLYTTKLSHLGYASIPPSFHLPT